MQTKKIKINGKDVEMREILVAAVEEIFSDPQVGIDIITDVMIGKPQGEIKLLIHCTDLTEEEIGKLGFGEFTRLVEAMKEVNPDFFAIYQKQMERLEQFMSRRGPSATPEPAIGSSGKGTETP